MRARSRSGVTLVEMMVVLAIIGIVAAASAPALRSSGPRRDALDEGRAALGRLLTDARRRAIASAATVRLTMEPATGRYWLVTTSSDSAMNSPSSSAILALPTGVSLAATTPRVHFAFDATGSAAGEMITVRAGARVRSIAVDPWTGALVDRAAITDDVLGASLSDAR